jgi:hypothetical protein
MLIPVTYSSIDISFNIYIGCPQDTKDKKLMSSKHSYNPDIIRISQQHPPDPAITTSANGGPRDDSLITALGNQRF